MRDERDVGDGLSCLSRLSGWPDRKPHQKNQRDQTDRTDWTAHPLRQLAFPKTSVPGYPAVVLHCPNEVRMTADDRYDVPDLPEAQFEPGSNGLVFKNLLGITSKHIMDKVEARALEQAMDVLVRAYGETHRYYVHGSL